MSGNNVEDLNIITRMDIPADRVLKAALKEGLSKVVICGVDEDGNEYFASSMADGGDTVWYLERCKKKLLDYPDEVAAELR